MGGDCIKSYFFNAEPTTDLEHHPTGYDRAYDADDHAAFFAPFFTAAGVFAGSDPEACRVEVAAGNTLRVRPGAAYVKGRMAVFDGTETIQVTQDCKICVRMDKTADVRAFRLVAVQELARTEDVYDLELARAAVVAVLGGYEVQVTDARPFMAFTGQPAYYPPERDGLPYPFWLYALGFPMTEEQRAGIEGNPGLMAAFYASLGASRADTVAFTAADWSAPDAGGLSSITLPRSRHGRSSAAFGHTLRHLSGGAYLQRSWAVLQTDVTYDAATGSITLTTPEPYPGEAVFYGAQARPKPTGPTGAAVLQLGAAGQEGVVTARLDGAPYPVENAAVNTPPQTENTYNFEIQ